MSKTNRCDWCGDKITKLSTHCDECRIDFEDIEKQLTPAREAVADAGTACAAIKLTLDKVKEAAHAADTAVFYVEKSLRSVLCEALAVQDVTLGIHGCKHSPTNKCVYDASNDPARISCLLCANPYDRQ